MYREVPQHTTPISIGSGLDWEMGDYLDLNSLGSCGLNAILLNFLRK